MLDVVLAILAQATSPVAAPTLSNQAKVDNLMILQLWSNNPDEFMRAWNQLTPPTLITTTKIERNKPISAFIIFAGCRGDAAGKCNLNGSIEFRDPYGKIYGKNENLDFWSGPPIEGFNLRLSPIGPGLIIEDGEKLGDYTVRITVTDRNADVTAVTEEKLTVVEAGAK
jgi:hypothetical protein